MVSSADRQGRDLHHVVRGQGRSALLLLHGLSQSHETFAEFSRHLPADLQLHLVDLPGHGRSCRLDEYAVTHMVERVAARVAASSMPVILYGHSLGALVAIGVAARCAEQVERLILSDPPLVFWDAPRWKDSLISSYFGWARKVLRGPEDEASLRAKLQTVFPHRDAAIVRRQARALQQLDAGILDALFETGLADWEDIHAWLEAIACPTLVLQADPRVLAAMSDEQAEQLLGLLQKGAHVKFEKADHDLHLWKPARVAKVVHDFLQGMQVNLA